MPASRSTLDQPLSLTTSWMSGWGIVLAWSSAGSMRGCRRCWG